ncbi:MAG: outer membrane protein transport protein [Gammaproteobacteria bacterium]|nr:outer membrane protein transport protein [Gammaproteobacteria bacterium]MDH3750495.1 outer membrane protein transport protein [Gammaproteobacteria bacterium]
MTSRVKRISSYTGVSILLLVGLLAPAVVSAQQPIVPLQLSFSDPGARSMGFGGAFVALADDATAAFANPAGLAQLLKPEVSIEGRHWRYSTPYTVGGRAEGLPSGNGIDTTAGLRTSTSKDDPAGISFLSFAYPLGNWSLAIFRHENANLGFDSETQGLFYAGTDCCQDRYYDQRATSELDFLSYGFSAAYRIGDKFDLGFGVVYHDASLESNVAQFLWDDDSQQSFYGPNSYLTESWRYSQRSFVDDTDWTLTAGFLWRLSEGWSIGGVYRQGLEAGIEYEVTAGEAVDFGVPPGEVFIRASARPIEFPDIYGLGFAYKDPDGRLTVTFQWDRVEYSDIPSSLPLDDQTIDDANELHLGAEYVFLGSTPIIAVRVGAWLDPDHQMRATSDDPFIRALMPRGDDEVHYAAGIGVAMQKFQIDFAMDFADQADTLSLSAIYSF